MQSILHARLAFEADGEKGMNRYVLATTQMQSVDEPFSVGALSSIAPPPHRGPGLSLVDGLLPRLSSVSIATTQLMRRAPNQVQATECARQVLRLLEDFKTWEASLPEEWLCKPYPNPRATITSPFPARVLVFPTLSVGGVWMAKWLAQLAVLRNMVLLEPIVRKIGVPFPLPAEIREQVASVAALLCSTVPYLLGNVAQDGQARASGDTPAVGAFFAVRSLFVTAQLPGLTREQVSWMLDRLEEIGRERGIHRALFLRESLIGRGRPNLG